MGLDNLRRQPPEAHPGGEVTASSPPPGPTHLGDLASTHSLDIPGLTPEIFPGTAAHPGSLQDWKEAPSSGDYSSGAPGRAKGPGTQYISEGESALTAGWWAGGRQPGPGREWALGFQPAPRRLCVWPGHQQWSPFRQKRSFL